MIEFKANLNPSSSKSDVTDLLKMDDYLSRSPILKNKAKPNNMIKSNADDKGVEFRFNSNQNANDTTG